MKISNSNFLSSKISFLKNIDFSSIKNKILSKILKGAVFVMNIPVPTTHKFLSKDDIEKFKELAKPGDIILTANDRYPGWALAEKLLLGSDWSHSGVYIGKGKVIDAESGADFSGVEKISIEDFLDGRHHAILLRPKYKSKNEKKAVLDYVKKQLGKPYDTDFDTYDDSAFYCTELPYQALKNANFNMKDINPKSTIIGKDIVSAQSYADSKNIEKIYSTENDFWTNQASHLPFLLKASFKGVIAGALFSLVSLPVGLVVGGLTAGFEIGRQMQAVVDDELGYVYHKQSDAKDEIK